MVLNAQTKIQYDAKVYLCRSEVLLIFNHDQAHVMIDRDAHTYMIVISPFWFSYKVGITISH